MTAADRAEPISALVVDGITAPVMPYVSSLIRHTPLLDGAFT
jgi:hypothetical protein